MYARVWSDGRNVAAWTHSKWTSGRITPRPLSYASDSDDVLHCPAACRRSKCSLTIGMIKVTLHETDLYNREGTSCIRMESYKQTELKKSWIWGRKREYWREWGGQGCNHKQYTWQYTVDKYLRRQLQAVGFPYIKPGQVSEYLFSVSI